MWQAGRLIALPKTKGSAGWYNGQPQVCMVQKADSSPLQMVCPQGRLLATLLLSAILTLGKLSYTWARSISPELRDLHLICSQILNVLFIFYYLMRICVCVCVP